LTMFFFHKTSLFFKLHNLPLFNFNAVVKISAAELYKITRSLIFKSKKEIIMPDYNYTDYGTIDEDAYVESNGPINKMKGGVLIPFPQKLHKILDQGIHSDIISWAPHGRCFLIHHPKLFVEIVLPNFFNATKKASFTRQLNLYGFVRLLSNGCDKGGYYHEKFLRGKSNLCKLIKRTPLKGSEHSSCANSQQEPKFYTMPYLPQISTSASTSASPCSPHSSSSDFSPAAYAPSICSSSSEKMKVFSKPNDIGFLRRLSLSLVINERITEHEVKIGIFPSARCHQKFSSLICDDNFDKASLRASTKYTKTIDPVSSKSVSEFDYETKNFINQFF